LGSESGALVDEGQISFGPELGFGIKIAQTVAKPIILKVAMTGST
jgi:hypothetical protein